jgi:hypothetical protein
MGKVKFKSNFVKAYSVEFIQKFIQWGGHAPVCAKFTLFAK